LTDETWIARVAAEFPAARDLVEYLERAGCLIEHAVPSSHRPTGYMDWQLWVRLPARLDEQFDLGRPVLLYCSSKGTLPPDTMNRVRQAIRESEGRVEPDVAFVATADRAAPDTIRKWRRDVQIVPLVTSADQRYRDGALSEDLADLLAHSLYERDLYDELTPVTGDHFFGRARELNALARDLTDGRHCGVFGLRKIGKTSLLYRLRDRLRETGSTVPVFLDLQSVAAAGDAGHAAWRLGQELLSEVVLSEGGITHDQVAAALDLPERAGDRPSRQLLVDLFHGLETMLQSASERLIIILDEIEVLIPAEGTPLPLTAEFLRGLRAIAQQTQQVSIVVAGVNSSISERPRLADADNPLFGVLVPTYIGPLTKQDCRELISRLGRRMGLRWPGSELMALVTDVGAHPALARLAASRVAALDPARPRLVTNDDVATVTADFHLKFNARFVEMVDSLRRYYPEEFALLEFLVAGDTEFVTAWRSVQPDAFNHLVSYGIVDQSPAIAIPAFARWLRAQQ
jgi:serine/threonine-protein kinase